MTAALDRAAFYDRVRERPFLGRLAGSQVSGMEAILDACPADLPTDHLAYCLATTWHETAYTMRPIEEYGHGKGRAYGKPTGPWHKVYDGRGDVQLTWLKNYQRATTELHARGLLVAGEDLAKDPDLALRPEIAAEIMFLGMSEGWFTGKKLGDYFRPGKADAKGARRIINGQDKAAIIAGYWHHFRDALVAAKHAPAGPAPKPLTDEKQPTLPLTNPPSVRDKPPAPPMAKKAKPKPTAGRKAPAKRPARRKA